MTEPKNRVYIELVGQQGRVERSTQEALLAVRTSARLLHPPACMVYNPDYTDLPERCYYEIRTEETPELTGIIFILTENERMMVLTFANGDSILVRDFVEEVSISTGGVNGVIPAGFVRMSIERHQGLLS